MSIESIKISLSEFQKTRDFDAFEIRSLQSTEDFAILIDISLDLSNEKLSNTGSWICTRQVQKHKSIFQKAIPQIIEFIDKGHHQSSLRSWMKVLTFLEPEEEFHGKLIDVCCQFIADSNNKVALQVYSIMVLTPLVHIYPELYPEIDALIEHHSLNKTVAYSAAWRKFKRNTKNISL